MLNNFILVGRIVSDLEPTTHEITLAVTRSYKNLDGTYDTDFIPVTLMGTIAENTTEYCRKGDLIGVKGHIQTRTIQKEEETEKYIELIAEKVTFLSSHTPTPTQDTTNDMSKGEI